MVWGRHCTGHFIDTLIYTHHIPSSTHFLFKERNLRLKELINLPKVTEMVSREPITSNIWPAGICCPLEESRMVGAGITNQTLRTAGS